jgi:hypothetical protein
VKGAPETASLLGADPLDEQIVAAPGARRADRSWWVRHRLAEGLSATLVPGLLLVVGLVLGPEGTALLEPRFLTSLDPAVSAALAALGLMVGVGLAAPGRRDLHLLGLASAEAGLTFGLVCAATLGVLSQEPSLVGVGPLLAVLLAIGASASSGSSASADVLAAEEPRRAVDVDDVLPILLGGLALAYARSGALSDGLALFAQCTLAAAAVTAAAWLLLSRPGAEAGRHVFTAGLVLLLGGLAEYLGTSALYNGLVAGVLLRAAGGPARDAVARDVGHLQHPLLVMLLLVAGARVSFSPGVFMLVLAAVALRLGVKLAAARLLRSALPDRADPGLIRQLIAPGALAPAFALNCTLAGADPHGLLLPAAVLVSIFSELLALLVRDEVRR